MSWERAYNKKGQFIGLKFLLKQPIRIISGVFVLDPDTDVDDEGFMILSTDDIEDAFTPVEWPIGTEAPTKECDCMIPDVAIYVGLNKQVEYCKACGRDMPK